MTTTASAEHDSLAELPVGLAARVATSAPLAARREQVMLTVRGSVNFDLRAGEILGIAGCERATLLRRLFGVQHPELRVTAPGQARHIASPGDALRAGIVLIPNAPGEPVRDHRQGRDIVLPSLRRFIVESRGSTARPFKRRLEAGNPGSHPVGSRQPFVLSKWLGHKQSVLLLDEPTLGLDVKLKLEVHRAIREQATNGNALVVSSSEAVELSILCHRVLVLRHGAICGELARANISEANIL